MGALIFSDESGRWSDATETLYVRSFVVIDADAYDKKVGRYKRLFPKNREIKWSTGGFARDEKAELRKLLLEDIHAFIVFTDIPQFRRKKYNIKTQIENLDYNKLLEDFKDRFELKNDLLNKVNQLLFLNVYERNFFIRFVSSLRATLTKTTVQNIYFDNPQQNNDDFAAVVRSALSLEASVPVTFVKNDVEELGIGIADLISGCFKDVLIGEERRNALSFYIKHIVPTLMKGTKANPNPSYQFWPDGNGTYKSVLRNLWK